MQSRKRILILAGNNILLFCSALAELLAQNEAFHVDIIDERAFGKPSFNLRNLPNLVIHFADHVATPAAAKIVKVCGKDAKLLLVLRSDEKQSVRLLANLDTHGIICSGASYPEFLTAISTLVFRNLKYISPSLIATFADPAANDPLAILSRKELDIARILTKGMRNFQIAAELNISPKTVNTYKARIYRKLGISNDMQLLKLTLQGESSEALSAG
jgi:DNA-binding NarL/FixJ family response regulator